MKIYPCNTGSIPAVPKLTYLQALESSGVYKVDGLSWRMIVILGPGREGVFARYALFVNDDQLEVRNECSPTEPKYIKTDESVYLTIK